MLLIPIYYGICFYTVHVQMNIILNFLIRFGVYNVLLFIMLRIDFDLYYTTY